MEFLTTGTNIILIVIGFGLLVTVHELGHFIAARWARIRVEAFAIGMGPSILSYRKGVGVRFGSTQPIVVARTGKEPEALTSEEQRQHGLGETEYSLRLLPLGGYVKMLGQEDANPAAVSDDPRSYTNTSIGARMVVVSAGVIMNILMAIVLFVIAFMSGVRFEAPVIGLVQAGSPAAAAGLEPGDTITSIDGGTVTTFSDVMIASALSKADDVLRVTVERKGKAESLTLSVAPQTDEGTGLRQIGISPALTATLSPQKDIQEYIANAFTAAGSSAAEAKALAGWSIDRVGATEVATWDDVDRAFESSNGAPTSIVWSAPAGDDSPPKTTLLTPDVDLEILYDTSPTGLEVTPGLAGLSPLVRIAEVPANSHNLGVIQAEDIVLSIGSIEGPRMAAFRGFVADHAGETVPMEVLRAGTRRTLEVSINAEGKVGVFPDHATDVALIARPLERAAFSRDGDPTPTPVAPLQLLPRTRINTVGGIEVDDFASIRKALRSATAEAHATGTAATVKIAWTLPLASAFHEAGSIELSAEDVTRLHALGYTSPLSSFFFEPLQVTLTAGGDPFKAVAMGFEETWDMVVLTYLTIDRLLRGSIGVEQLHGPVGIVHIGTRVIDRGFMYLLFFLAMISVNLAVLNFLPIPIVDGGLFVFLIYEKIRGMPPSIAFQNGATLVGLLLIGAIFIITFYNDIMRLAS